MHAYPTRAFPKFFILAAIGLAAWAASAAPVTHYSVADINSNESVNNAAPDRVVDFNGGPVQSQASGSRAWAYSNGFGGFMVNTETSSVFARSDLSTGALRSATTLGLGNITFGTPPAAGTRYAVASANAEFADQFRLYSGSTPYLWAADTVVSFSLGITGVTDIPATVPIPPDVDLTWANLRLNVFKVGTLDLIEQVSQIDLFPGGTFDNAAYQIWLALLNQINANDLHTSGWCLGNSRTPSDFCGGSFYENVPLDGSGAALIEYSFTPGEDFEWILGLETQVRLDLTLQNTAVTMDFGNTVNVGFNAPTGTTLYSASGLFPGSLDLNALPSDVPEPASLALCLIALLALGMTQRRRSVVARRFLHFVICDRVVRTEANCI